jgi:hypothetical protein
MRYTIVALGLVVVAAGTAAATHYYDRTRTPDDIRPGPYRMFGRGFSNVALEPQREGVEA